jgi:hypothetical protein
MALGPGRLARGRNQDKIELGRTLFQRRRRLREILQSRILDDFFLRFGGLLEGGVMRSKLEAITFPKLPEDSSFEDLKRETELKRDEAIQEEIRE